MDTARENKQLGQNWVGGDLKRGMNRLGDYNMTAEVGGEVRRAAGLEGREEVLLALALAPEKL